METEEFASLRVRSKNLIETIRVLPVEVEYVVEDFRVPVKEELVTLDNVVIAQIQLLAVVCVCGQSADPRLGIPGSQPVGQVVDLQGRN